jgi:hypothetical protein
MSTISPAYVTPPFYDPTIAIDTGFAAAAEAVSVRIYAGQMQVLPRLRCLAASLQERVSVLTGRKRHISLAIAAMAVAALAVGSAPAQAMAADEALDETTFELSVLRPSDWQVEVPPANDVNLPASLIVRLNGPDQRGGTG